MSPKHDIQLQAFTKNDYELLIRWINEERLMVNWTGSMFSFPLTAADLDWYTEESNDVGKSGVFIYKAVDLVTDKVVGHISLGTARVSRVLVGKEAQRGVGICQKMMRGILKIGFEELKLHRISLGVYDFNKAAIRCYERAGFRTEGIARDIFLYENEYWSMVEMSILEDEWKP